MKKLLIFLAIAALFGTYAFKSAKETVGENKVIVGSTEFFVDVADDRAEYIKGLSGRQGLRENEGMLFLFDKTDRHGFWMKDMLFPIDIIWISNGKVIGFAEDLEPAKTSSPPLYYPPSPVNTVLEVRSGTIEKKFIKIGDPVQILLTKDK